MNRLAIALIAAGASLTAVTGTTLTTSALTTPALAAQQARPHVPVRVTRPATTTTSDRLNHISCPSTSFCFVIGSNGRARAAQTWNGHIWTALSVPGSGYLDGVSCVSATGCMVVGNGPAGLTGEWWNGSAWRAVNPPTPAQASIDGISCASASSCMIVGGSGLGGVSGPLVTEAWNGSTWRVLPTPSPGGPAQALTGVSCPSASNCMAVGWYYPDNEQELALAMQWNGSSWTVLSTPPDDPNLSPELSGVSCLSSSDCMAVGTDGSATLAVRWNGTAWTQLTTPGAGTWSGVSCVAGGTCVAVGTSCVPSGGCIADSPAQSGYQTLSARWNGSSWQSLTTVNPGSSNYMLGISCASAANCLAVGLYDVPGGAQLGLDEAWNGRTWQVPLDTGYLALTPDGGVANFSASWYGSERGHLASGNKAIAIAPYQAAAPSGDQTSGYWILDSGGGIANFNAPWFGSERGHVSSSPVAVAEDPLAPSPGGYAIVNANGSVASYGGAAPHGGEPSGHATGLAFDPATGGYWIINANGGIANIDAPWFGSLAGKTTQAPTGIAGY